MTYWILGFHNNIHSVDILGKTSTLRVKSRNILFSALPSSFSWLLPCYFLRLDPFLKGRRLWPSIAQYFVFSLALKLYCLLWTEMPCYLQYTVLLFQGYHHLPNQHNGAVVNCRDEEGNREAPPFSIVPIASHCTVPVLFLGTDNIHSLRKRGEISFTNQKYYLKLNRSSLLLKTSALISKQFNQFIICFREKLLYMLT